MVLLYNKRMVLFLQMELVKVSIEFAKRLHAACFNGERDEGDERNILLLQD